jgi:hypothetical protein
LLGTAVYSSLCTQTNLRVTYSGQTGGWSESTLILNNESQSKITRLIRVDQSQASKLVTEDRRTTEKVTYRALGSRKWFSVFFHGKGLTRMAARAHAAVGGVFRGEGPSRNR